MDSVLDGETRLADGMLGFLLSGLTDFSAVTSLALILGLLGERDLEVVPEFRG